MRVKSLEIIRKKAVMTEYRFAKMLSIQQTNYKQIVNGEIAIPNGKIVLKIIMIAVTYAKMTYESAVLLLAKDLGISIEAIEELHKNERKK